MAEGRKDGIRFEKHVPIMSSDEYSYGYQICKVVDRDLARIGGGRLAAHKSGGILGQALQKTGRLLEGPVDYLEIGSQFGGSAVVAGFLNNGGQIVCIDPMETLKGHNVYGMVNDGQRGHVGARPIFDWNMEHYGMADRVTLIEELSVPFPKLPEGFAPNVTYVDGDHSYEFALADLQNVGPITSHFIVCDDYIHWTGVRPAVHEFLQGQDRWTIVYADYSIAILADVEKTGKDGADLNFIIGISEAVRRQSQMKQEEVDKR